MEEAKKYLFVVASMAGRRFQWLKGRHKYHVEMYIGMSIVLLVHLPLTLFAEPNTVSIQGLAPPNYHYNPMAAICFHKVDGIEIGTMTYNYHSLRHCMSVYKR